MFFDFHPYLAKISIFHDHIFQMGWFNHQLEKHARPEGDFLKKRSKIKNPFWGISCVVQDAGSWLNDSFRLGFPN